MYNFKCLAGAMVALGLLMSGGAQAAHGVNDDGDQNFYTCPGGKTIHAIDVRTPEDARAFVRCAKAFIQEHDTYGLEWFRESFDEPQWNAGKTYVFVDQNTDGNRLGGLSQSQIYPPDATEEGTPWPLFIDGLGNSYFKIVYHIASRWTFAPGEGFLHYKWNAPTDDDSSIKQSKTSYVIRLSEADFPGAPAPRTHETYYSGEGDDKKVGTRDASRNPDGHGYIVGSGVYPPELQESRKGCDAAGLDEEASTRKLQDFVRCAAREYAELPKAKTTAADIINTPFFARVATHLRAGSIYTFVVGVDPSESDYGKLDWTSVNKLGSGQSVQAGRDPEWVSTTADMGIPNSRDAVKVAVDMGESFLYYKHRAPNGEVQRKVTFLKLVSRPDGEVLIGSGYYLSDSATLEPNDGDGYCDTFANNTAVRNVTAPTIETRDDLQAFVMKARCHIEKVGIPQARRDFGIPNAFARSASKESDWYSKRNNIYLFVDEHKEDGDVARLFIYPPYVKGTNDNGGKYKGINSPYGNYNDVHGNPYYAEVYRIQQLMGEGWMYYNFKVPSSGRQAWKASYIARFTGKDGSALRIGAGIYEASAPGSCDAVSANSLRDLQESARADFSRVQQGYGSSASATLRWVNGEIVDGVELQSQMSRDTATTQLQAFVRCAAQKFESMADIDAAKKVMVTGPNPGATNVDVEARTAGNGKWRSTVNSPSKIDHDNDPDTPDQFIQIDGQWNNRPIYTFVYDDKGKVVWARDAAQHQHALVFSTSQAERQARYDRAVEDYNACMNKYAIHHRHRCAGAREERDQLKAVLDGYAENKTPYMITEFEYGRNRADYGDREEGTYGRRAGPRGQNTLKILDTFGEAFVYYQINDYRGVERSESGRSSLSSVERMTIFNQNKRSFMKKVRTQDGKVYYIGAGLYE